jgi:hypothetical protein
MSAHLTALSHKYLERFPVSTEDYDVKKFDNWGWSRAVPRLHRLPELDEQWEYGPTHPEWGSHLDRRHDLRKKINRGARLLAAGEQFYIVVEAQKRWRTCNIVEAATNGSRSLGNRIARVMKTKFGNVYRLQKSPDLTRLSREMQIHFRSLTKQQQFTERKLRSEVDYLEEHANDALAEARAEVVRMQSEGRPIGELGFLLELDLPALPAPNRRRLPRR